jgi:hypothetical protein
MNAISSKKALRIELLLTGVRGSALCGVLAEIEALGLSLLKVRQLTADCESPEIR